MKILKPGKVEQRKFACPKCDCIFVANKTETKYSLGTDYVVCPFCGNDKELTWKYGEPYEEPERDEQSDALRLYKLMKGTWPYSFGALSALSTFLAANGVTFREGTNAKN